LGLVAKFFVAGGGLEFVMKDAEEYAGQQNRYFEKRFVHILLEFSSALVGRVLIFDCVYMQEIALRPTEKRASVPML